MEKIGQRPFLWPIARCAPKTKKKPSALHAACRWAKNENSFASLCRPSAGALARTARRSVRIERENQRARTPWLRREPERRTILLSRRSTLSDSHRRGALRGIFPAHGVLSLDPGATSAPNAAKPVGLRGDPGAMSNPKPARLQCERKTRAT